MRNSLYFLATAFLMLGCGSLYEKSEYVGIGLSRIQSPIHFVSNEPINKPLGEEEQNLISNFSSIPFQIINFAEVAKNLSFRQKEELLPIQAQPTPFDHYNGEKTLFVICVSGGGMRAAALASHTLSLLEKKYNENRDEESPSFVDLIHAFSSVSGGSIFSSYIAARMVRLPKENRDHFFLNAARDLQDGPSTLYSMGARASLSYFRINNFPLCSLVIKTI
jgi:hypothetical protein